MEVLVNEILRLGGDRRRLVAKVFGGARVLELTQDAYSVSFENARFISEFLATEGIPIVARRLGGTEALEVRFEVHTGRVRVRPIGPERAASAVAEEERRHLQLLARTCGTSPIPPMIF
jgi:chemotaxis receptor (MCP) glutamine deamidase CheD